MIANRKLKNNLPVPQTVFYGSGLCDVMLISSSSVSK